ncbi:hypothetical protein GCM10011383_21760 [Hymenobacter cavernae]|uniref:Glycosyltransferase RgtA/B/C/D-like domain-containing protein n=1 Tax=Hymenobacter cavernae TaxID=2044852 RepID=A0ABQ1U4A6_9BACT|nr:hypothetical protein GCM10011383_21760 [Hymenobacter cavernae]
MFRVLVLPGLLLLATGLGLGCYYETNDDLAITQLLCGASAAAPVTDLHLYFHGLARVLATLYQVAPMWPWYGLLLYGLLYVATVSAFTILDKLLHERVPAAGLNLGLVVFFTLTWLEHSLWFNYVRVPILLSGMGLLLAAQHARRKQVVGLGLLMAALAWAVRPSAAALGLLAAAPGAWWLGGKPALRVLAAASATIVLASLGLLLTSSPEAAAYRTLDVLKSNRNDYQLYRTAPHTAVDSLGLQAVDHWLLGDSVLVNDALFQRAAQFDVGYFLQREAFGKLCTTLSLLTRDYFPLLLGQLALFWLVRRRPGQRLFWLVQLAYGLLVLGLGVWLKLPPRLGLPLMNLWLLSNLAYVLTTPFLKVPPYGWRMLGLGVVLLLALYSYKTLHRVQILRREQAAHEAYLGEVQRFAAGRLIVTANLEVAYKSLSPFKVYNVSRRPTLSLTGWPTLDPSNAVLRQQLTGTRDLPLALQCLASQPDVVWLLTPPMARFLTSYLAATTSAANLSWRLQVGEPLSADTLLPRPYQIDVEPMK